MLMGATFKEWAARASLLQDSPLGRASAGTYKQEFLVRSAVSEVLYSRARQAAAAYDSIARDSRPSRLYGDGPHAGAKLQELADHSRVPDREPVRFLPLDLYAASGAIGLAGQIRKRRYQPGDRGASHEIIGRAQGQIVCHVPSRGGTCAPLGLGQQAVPLLVQFTHSESPDDQ
jgi:hypothetical protein